MARNSTTTDLPTDAADAPELKGRAARRARKKAAKAGKTPWYKQIWQVFQMTRQSEPLIWLWMLLVVIGVVGLFALFGTLVWRHHEIYMGTLGLPVGLIGSLFLLMNRAERAAYAKIEGQEGAAAAAIGQIRRGYTFDSDPVAIDPRSHAMVFRGVGRPGVILVAEGGPEVRLNKLIDGEKRKVSRVAPDIPIIVLRAGNEAGQVPLRKLSRTIQRLRPKISKAEVSVVIRRLKAIGGANLAIPKGIDPARARPDRKALRGR